ncbi:hypothetical protein KPC83_07045 [Collinsella sp. zg1085]|uniref:hypothetical protein n=1 Tax=Collinsella sp. zg1085 TaxID=2844380 RepID=UPI001C0D8DE7|nr:hypothetical protein [Collinsella sp. zg1085]QWT17579.1 hypothetical protein KPC83_07045 [Collinsella sp. zg1085]
MGIMVCGYIILDLLGAFSPFGSGLAGHVVDIVIPLMLLLSGYWSKSKPVIVASLALLVLEIYFMLT